MMIKFQKHFNIRAASQPALSLSRFDLIVDWGGGGGGEWVDQPPSLHYWDWSHWTVTGLTIIPIIIHHLIIIIIISTTYNFVTNTIHQSKVLNNWHCLSDLWCLSYICSSTNGFLFIKRYSHFLSVWHSL